MINSLIRKECNVNFVIECLLGLQAAQKMNMVTINSENFIGKEEKDLSDLGEARLKIEDDAILKTKTR